jgi:hypothetical protein
MLDRSKVLGMVLRDARERVRDDWGSGNADLPEYAVSGSSCASVAISRACGTHVLEDTSLAAHTVFLQAAGVPIPESDTAIVVAVYEWNDAQVCREAVLEAFDAAIQRLEDAASCSAPAEATPNADATLEIMAVCDMAAVVVAGHLADAHWELDEAEVRLVCAAEFFATAQEMAKAAALDIRFERP